MFRRLRLFLCQPPHRRAPRPRASLDPCVNFLLFGKMVCVSAALLTLLALYTIKALGFQWGVGFSGGMLLEISCTQPLTAAQIQGTLGVTGAQCAMLGDPQTFLLRFPNRPALDAFQSQVIVQLRALDPGLRINRLTASGPHIGAERSHAALLAVGVVGLEMLAYITWRFGWPLAIGALLAIFFNLTVTLGIFSYTQLEVNITVITALLVLLGYSLNTTIFVFGRIRENFATQPNASTERVVNLSIGQTFARNLIAPLTTLLPVALLLLLGGRLWQGFATTLLVGLSVGTGSSMYMASTLGMLLGLQRPEITEGSGPQTINPASHAHPGRA